ncbi:MAG: molybdopterin-dependent oxidoreductase [Desulfurococcales archaeon]|nr:molybdopterin-dependent oxidoreductase [Desulfurococcales archaeon]
MSGGITRRDFLKIAGITGLLVGISGVSYETLKKADTLSMEAASKPKIQYKPGHCGMCPQGCSIMTRVVNGRAERIFGNPYGFVFNRGTVCARGNMGIYRLYNPDRLMKPLIRSGGERGTWRFRDAGWNEAFDKVVSAVKPIYQNMMQEYQKVYQQTGDQFKAAAAMAQKDKVIWSAGWFGCDIYRPQIFALLISLGFSNAFSQPIATCFLPKVLGWSSVVGVGVQGSIIIDYDNVKYLLSIRRNPFGSISVSHASRVGQDLRKFKLVVVDPRLSEEAARADEWVPIKPGTDLAFLLGLMYVILDGKLYDEDYLREYSDASMLVDPETLEPLNVEWVQGREPNENMPYPRPWSVKCFKVYDLFTNNVVCNTEAKMPALRGEYDVDGKKYVPALEALYRHLDKNGYTPEWAEKITGIPAKKIEEIAVEFATTKPAAIDTGWHGTKTYNSFQSWRAMGILNALVGSYCNRGGFLISASALEDIQSDLNPAGMPAPAWNPLKFMGPPWSPIWQVMSNQELKLSDGSTTKGVLFNLGRSFMPLKDLIKKEPGWVILNVGANIARTTIDGDDWFENTLKSKNVNLVMNYDVLPTDTSLYSDVVLNDCIYLESYDLIRPVEFVPYGALYTGVPAVENPVGNCVPFTVFAGLFAKELGKAKEYGTVFARLLGLPEKQQNEMAALFESLDRSYLGDSKKGIEFLAKIQEIQAEGLAAKFGLSKNGILEDLRTKGFVVFKDKEDVLKENMEVLENHKLYTATGLLEIYSITLQVVAKNIKGEIKPEWHPLIDWVPPRVEQVNEELNGNEFYVIYGKVPTMTHTSTADNPLLERLTRENYRRIWIHPSRAAYLGVSEGDMVEVCSVLGKCYNTRVHVTERVRPDTVFVPFAYGLESPRLRFAPGPDETVPYNKIVPPEIDPVTGSAILGDIVVSIKKA